MLFVCTSYEKSDGREKGNEQVNESLSCCICVLQICRNEQKKETAKENH